MKQTWDRRYFAIQDDLLVYHTRGKVKFSFSFFFFSEKK